MLQLIKKEGGEIRSTLNTTDKAIVAVDLPGAYSMSPFTSEESITSEFVNNENPDVIINIVDATNLSRSLFFTTQLLELDIPVVVALNKSDLNVKKKTNIDTKELSEKLGCPVVETISTKSGDNGLTDLMNQVLAAKGSKQKAPFDATGEDFADENSVKAFDKKRFEFVKGIVHEVEDRAIKLMLKRDKMPWIGF